MLKPHEVCQSAAGWLEAIFEIDMCYRTLAYGGHIANYDYIHQDLQTLLERWLMLFRPLSEQSGYEELQASVREVEAILSGDWGDLEGPLAELRDAALEEHRRGETEPME